MKKIMGASGRFDATGREHRALLDSTFEEFESDVLLETETSPRGVHTIYATYAYKHHLHLVHFGGRDGQAECLIMSKQPVEEHRLLRLTNMTMDRGGPVHVYMPVAKVNGLWLGAVHTPAHNFDLREGEPNTEVYLDMLEGMKNHLPEGRKAIHGDWNLAVDDKTHQARLLAHHPRMHFLVPDKPTEGRRKIDALMTTEDGHAQTLPPLPGFDHRRVMNHVG